VKCIECNFETDGLFIHCPFCGAKAFSYEDISELKNFLDTARGPIDRSPEGIELTKYYIKVTRTNIAAYAEGVQRIFDHFKKMPKRFRNKKWDENAKVLLEVLLLVSVAMPSEEIGDPNRILSMPQGCFNLAFALSKIQDHTLEFCNQSSKFITTRKPIDLKRAIPMRDNAFEQLEIALKEIDLISEQIQ